MKAYVISTGVVFGLIVGLHIVRLFADGLQVATNPFFAISTLLALALFLWACLLLRRLPRS